MNVKLRHGGDSIDHTVQVPPPLPLLWVPVLLQCARSTTRVDAKKRSGSEVAVLALYPVRHAPAVTAVSVVSL